MAVFLFLFCLILMLIWSAPMIMQIIKLLLSLLCVLWCDWNNELNCFQKCHTSHPCCESLQRHDKRPYKYRLNPFSIKCLEQNSRCFPGYSFKLFLLEWKASYFEAVNIMAWHHTCDKALPAPVTNQFIESHMNRPAQFLEKVIIGLQ